MICVILGHSSWLVEWGLVFFIHLWISVVNSNHCVIVVKWSISLSLLLFVSQCWWIFLLVCSIKVLVYRTASCNNSLKKKIENTVCPHYSIKGICIQLDKVWEIKWSWSLKMLLLLSFSLFLEILLSCSSEYPQVTE